MHFLIRKERKGMSLMEIMAIMAVIAIASNFIFPALSNFFSGDSLTAEGSRLASGIRAGRALAIERQVVHRLIFSTDFFYYKIEAFTGQDESGSGDTLIDDNTNSETYDNANWVSILEEPEIEFSYVEVLKEPSMPNCIFFWPNGKLVTRIDPLEALSDANVIGIPECYIMLVYGGAGIRIVMNAHGVFTSEAYAPDDDFTNDDAESIW